MKRLVAVLTAAVLGLMLAACSSGKGSSATQTGALDDRGGLQCSTYCGFGLDPAQPRPSFTLADTSGKPFSFGSATAGHPTLLYFGYTHCPDVCPETMADVHVALQSVPANLQQKTYVVFVTTDPTRDTGPVLNTWLDNWRPDTTATFVGLRGTADEIHAAEALAHVTPSEDDGQTHSAELLLYGTDNYARVSYNVSSIEQDSIAHDLPLVAKSS